MVFPRKIRDIVFCVVLLIIPVLLLQSNLKNPHHLNFFDRILLRITAPAQSLFTGAISGIHRAWVRYIFLVNVQVENERLKRETQRQKVKIQEGERQLVRLKRYEQLLGFRNTHNLETVGVRVISRDSSPFVRALRIRIDRGRPLLRPNLAVITAEGIVGQVGKVYGSYADLILAVDPKNTIDVIIQRTGGRGLLRGIDGSNSYVCRIDYLLRKEDVRVGDLVVTSGVGGIFPKDLVVGRISQITKRTYGLYQEVVVTPSVDFSTLDEMLVILSPPPPAVPVLERGMEPAWGFVP